MAAGDRESTFTLRAADLSSQPIKDVVTQLDKLVESQKQLNESAQKGAISNTDFKKALTDLSAVFKGIVDQRAALSEFLRVQDTFATRTAAVAAANERLAEAKNKLYGGDEKYTVVTEKEIASLGRFEKQITSAESKAASAKQAFELFSGVIAKMGVTAENFAEKEAEIAAAIERTIPAIQAANKENLELIANRQKATAASDAAAAAVAREAEADKAFAAANRQANAERAAAGEAIAQREKRDADARANARKFDLESAFAAADKEKELSDSRETAQKRQAATLAALAASQEKLAGARSGIPGTQGPGQASDALPRFTEASDAVSGIVNPAQAARQSLDGVAAEVDRIAESMRGGKKRVEEYAADVRNLTLVFSELARQSGLVDTFKTQEAELRRLDAALKQETATLEAMTGLYARGNAVNVETERRILAQTAAVKAATVAYNSQNAGLTQTRQLLERAGIDYKNVEDVLVKLTAAAGRAREAYEIADKARDKNQSGSSFLGLKGYELVNLSYQLNDVITQYASGTHVGQIFAQQAGQIFQIFERDGISAVGKLKQFPVALGAAAAGAAAATIAVLAFVRALEIAGERRSFIGQLALDVDGARINLDKLVDSSKELRSLGVGIGDAIGGGRALAGQGFAQDRIQQLQKLAALQSSIYGKSYIDSIKEVGAAFSGGYKELSKFIDVNNSLDSSTARVVRALFDEGKSVEATTLALEVSIKRTQDAYDKSTSAVTAIFRNVSSFFDKLFDNFNKGVELVANGALRLAEISDNQARGTYGAKDRRNDTAFGINFGGGVPTTGGGSQALGESRGDRNNNPGNLEFARQENAGRENGDSGRFARFLDLESGVAAALRQYILYQEPGAPGQRNRGKQSVQDLVETATPPKSKGGDNPDADVAKYVKFVADALKVGINDPINLKNRETAEKYLQAVAVREGNSPISEKALKGGADRVFGDGSGGQPAASTPATLLEGQKRVTTDYLKDVKDATDALKDSRLEGDASLHRENEIIKNESEKIRADAKSYASEHHQADIDNEAVQKAIDDRAAVRRAQYAQARLDKEKSVAQELAELGTKVSGADPTNLQQRLAAVDAEFKARKDKIEQEFKGIDGAQKVNGRSKDEVLADIDVLRKAALDNEALKVAEATLDKVLQARKEALDANNKLQLTGQAASDAAIKVNQQFTPQIQKAIADLNAALGKVPDSPAVQAARVKGQVALNDLTGAQSDTNASLKSAFDQSQKPLQDLLTIRQNGVNAIVELLKSGSINIGEGLRRLSEVTSKLTPEIEAAVSKVNGDLKALLSNPALSPVERSNILAAIAKNTADAAKSQEQIQAVLDAGLKDSTEKLSADTASRDRQVSDVLKQLADRLIGPEAASSKLAAIFTAFKDKIKEDSAKLIAELEQALKTPGLTPGARASLEDRLSKAKLVDNTDKPEREAATNVVNTAFNQLQGSSLGGLRDTQATNAQLLSKNLITQTGAEESNKRAFADANAAAAVQIKQIEKTIAGYQKLGQLTPGQVELLRNKIKLLQADLQYIDPLTKQITDGLENSFVNRGAQAFDTVAQALANVATNGGKLSDVVRAVGQAFATFTAGVLEDVAKIIIKYELLKLIKDALGVGGGEGGDGTDPITTKGAAGSPLLSLAKGVFSAITGISLPKNIAGDSDAGPTFTSGQTEPGNAGAYTSDGSGQGYSPDSSAGIDESIRYHSGGLVGSPGGQRRTVDLSVFHTARRYHDGGAVGLGNDEVPAILQRGERVQSIQEVKQAAMAKAAGGGGGGTPVRNVLAVGDDEISKAMNGSHGEQVVLNHLRRNAPTVRKLIGG